MKRLVLVTALITAFAWIFMDNSISSAQNGRRSARPNGGPNVGPAAFQQDVQGMAQAMIAQFDANGDQMLDQAELERGLAALDQHVRQMISETTAQPGMQNGNQQSGQCQQPQQAAASQSNAARFTGDSARQMRGDARGGSVASGRRR